MNTTTALPKEKTTGAKDLIGKFLSSLPFFGMHKDRPRINLSSDGLRVPIKAAAPIKRTAATDRVIAPGVPLLSKGAEGNIQYYIIVEGKTFNVDPCCHLKDITEVDENWEKTIAISKGITVYSDQSKALVSYARAFYINNKQMPALQRICHENGREIEGENGRETMDIPRSEIYKLFTEQPTRVMAAIAGLPHDYLSEPLQKAPGFPIW